MEVEGNNSYNSFIENQRYTCIYMCIYFLNMRNIILVDDNIIMLLS